MINSGLKPVLSIAALLATTALAGAQTTSPAPADPAPPADATTSTAPAVVTAEPVDCAATFATLDADSDGMLTEEEAPAAYARARIEGTEIAVTGLDADQFAALCGAEEWASYAPEEGAPFSGANSFTEGQARDRAISWNVADVSELTLDDEGIWRGTGRHEGADVNVAIDYRGNVVMSPRN